MLRGYLDRSPRRAHLMGLSLEATDITTNVGVSLPRFHQDSYADLRLGLGAAEYMCCLASTAAQLPCPRNYEYSRPVEGS